MNYIALIGDLVGSRKIGGREEFQKKLKGVLSDINEKYGDCIASRFSVTLGDEFQGLLNDPSCLFDIVLFIKLRIYPVKVRFGIGAGEITTEIDPSESIGADGPAYHRAREALEDAEKSENQKERPLENVILRTPWPKEWENLLNSTLILMHSIESGWTKKQAENIYLNYFLSLNQTEIAQDKGINQSTVQRSLISSHANEYLGALSNISEFMSYAMKEGENQ